MALLRDEGELVSDFNGDVIFAALNEIYEDIFGLPLRRERFTIKDDVIVCDGSLRVKRSIRDTIESLEIPGVKIDYISGIFNCASCSKLKSLKGAPHLVGAEFSCSYCSSLESLEGGPERVGGNFNCEECTHIESLKGAPKVVGGHFNCSFCTGLESLDGKPKWVGGEVRHLSVPIQMPRWI